MTILTTYVSRHFYHVVLKSSENENSNSKKCFDNLVFLSEKENKFAHEITLETLYKNSILHLKKYSWNVGKQRKPEILLSLVNSQLFQKVDYGLKT